MSFFNFGKGKKDNVSGCECSCGGSCKDNSKEQGKENSRVKILGSGCKKCNDLEKNVVEALKELRESSEVEHVTDFTAIAKYGVMSTPALVIDEKVVSYGKVLKVEEAVKLIKEVMK